MAGNFYFKQPDQVVKEAVLIYGLSEGVDVQRCSLELGETKMIASLECQTEVNETNSDWLLSLVHNHDLIIPDVSMKNSK